MAKPKRKRWKVMLETVAGIQYFRVVNLRHVKEVYQVDLENNRHLRGLQPVEQWLLDVVMRDAVEDLNLESTSDISTVTMVKVEAGGE